MQNNEKLIQYVENSFLAPLLVKPSITDISYNGVDIFYQDNKEGRRKYYEPITQDQVGDFLRQIANFAEKQFSYMNPILDVSFSRYRLNATFLSVTRVGDRKSYSFSIRMEHEGSILEEAKDFFGGRSKKILLDAIHHHESVVIAGETGAGKTELQKYLIMHLPASTRVIVIDNLQELEMCRGNGDLDLTSWHVEEKQPEASFPALIRNALRSNPDYLIVAESRGKEMYDALQSVMSGHPIITTIHAKDLNSMPYRIARLAMLANDTLRFDDLMGDIYHHFTLMVYVKREEEDGEFFRHIDAIGRLDEATKTIELLYQYKRRNE